MNSDDLGTLLIVAVLFVPPILVAVLGRTKLFWLPGVALIVLGFVAFGSMPDTHDDVGGIAAMAAGILAIAGLGLLVYGVICLIVAARMHARASARQRAADPPPSAVELPPARVVNDASKI